jgi:hypothetical protein
VFQYLNDDRVLMLHPFSNAPGQAFGFCVLMDDVEGEACSGQGNDRSRNSRTRGQLVQEVMGCSEDQHAQLRRGNSSGTNTNSGMSGNRNSSGRSGTTGTGTNAGRSNPVQLAPSSGKS